MTWTLSLPFGSRAHGKILGFSHIWPLIDTIGGVGGVLQPLPVNVAQNF